VSKTSQEFPTLNYPDEELECLINPPNDRRRELLSFDNESIFDLEMTYNNGKTARATAGHIWTHPKGYCAILPTALHNIYLRIYNAIDDTIVV
jgi:hypothetical protein